MLALQGAFVEHEHILQSLGCRTIQVRTAAQLSSHRQSSSSSCCGDGVVKQQLDGMVFPGGESTAMGLIGSGELWTALQDFVRSGKPTWGTCAGMVLLAERCVGGSAVIENGQSLIGGLDVLVCRNYFGSQVSSFEMEIPPPPLSSVDEKKKKKKYPGVFIRAPAILTTHDKEVEVLGTVVATPCRQAAAVLQELDRKIAAGENVVMMGVVDALKRDEKNNIVHGVHDSSGAAAAASVVEYEVTKEEEEEKKDCLVTESECKIVLPGAAAGTNAREVICAVRKKNVLCTAFHPELTNDYRWHQFFLEMVTTNQSQNCV